MTNFDIAENALETSMNSSGSATTEHEKWMESLDSKLKQLQATWQGFAQSFMGSDFLKGFLESVTGLVKLLDKFVEFSGVIPTLIASFLAFKSFGNKGLFRVVEDQASSTGVKLTNYFSQAAKESTKALQGIRLKSDSNFAQGLKSDINALNNYRKEVARTGDKTAAFNTHMVKASESAMAFAKDNNVTLNSMKEYVAVQKSAEVSTIAQNKSLTNASSIIKEYNSGCKGCGLTQKQFADAVAKTNPRLAEQLVSGKSASAMLRGYATSMVTAKVASIGLQVAVMALNMALTMGVGALIGFAVKGIDKVINRSKYLAEEVEELTSKFKQQHEELKKLQGDYDASNETSMISKYGKLSKGVDDLGRNVSLAAGEYSEYCDIVNTIAEQIPSLIVGYDEQGNAILSVKGNVQELREEYEKLIHIQNQDILTKAGDIEKNFANIIKKSSGDGTWSDNHGFWRGFIKSDAVGQWFAGALDYDLKTDTVKNIEKLLDVNASNRDKKKALKDLKADRFSKHEIEDALTSANIEVGLFENPIDILEKTLKEDPQKIKGIVDNYYAGFADEVEKQKSVASAKLSEAFDVSDVISGLNYGNISEEMQAIAYQTVSSLDWDFLSSLSKSGKTLEQWTTELLDQLNAISEDDNDEIEAAFNLKTKFNGEEISYGEYVNGIQNVNETIDALNLDETAKSQIKLTLGLNEDGLVEEYDALLNRLTETNKDKISSGNIIGLSTEEAENLLDDLSAKELSVMAKVVPELDANATAEEIQAAIDREMAVQGLLFDLDIEVETDSIEALNKALAESVSAVGLSSESIAALKSRYAELESEGYNLSAMFEETSNGIHLNQSALGELEQAYAKQKHKDIEKDLKALEKEYDLLTKDIDDCTDAGERAALYSQRDAILDQINDAATLAAQYKGLASAYQKWQNIESAGTERDMYEGIIDGFENIEDELARGWLDDGTIAFLELLTGKTNLASKSGEDLKEIYDDLDNTIKNTSYSVSDFFTVDDDGNSTNAGVYNFLDAIHQLEKTDKFKGIKGIEKLVEKDVETGEIIGFNFDLVAKKDKDGNYINGDQVIAEALGVSEELVQIMLRAADDAGFVINLEGAYTQLADLKNEAQTAEDSLISFKKNGLKQLKDVKLEDLNFNFDAEGDDLVKEQERAVEILDNFRNKDGVVDLSIDGAQEALDIAEYLTVKVNDLTEPKYMQIDTSTVDEELRNPIEKMQDFEGLVEKKHLVSLTGDEKAIDKVEAQMEQVAKDIEELDPEIKTQLGIDEDWNWKTISKKLEKGEIEIPAELNVDLEMSDDLKDMRLMMMRELGLASDNEVKLKVGFDINENIVDKLTGKEQEVVIKYIEENKEEFDELTDGEKTAYVKIIADGTDIESWEAEEKEALVKYVVDGGNVEDWTPEQKEAFAKYLVDGGDVDGWTPEAKDAFVKYLVDGGDPDKFDPDDKESWVVYKKDSSEPDDYKPDDHEPTVTYQKDSSEVDSYNPPNYDRTVTFWATIKKKASDLWGFLTETNSTRNSTKGKNSANERSKNGGVGVDGTANVDGTTGRAFNRGNWGTISSGTALVGELGRETLIRGGRYYTIGDNGAEFIKYQKDDIIFNHKQTEELFKNGKVTSGGGRGKALVSGTAFLEGTAFSRGKGSGTGKTVIEADEVTINSKSTGSKGSGGGVGKVDGSTSAKSYGSKKSSKSSSSKSKSTKDDFEETFDWIEIAIARLERAIDRLDQKANRTWKSWSSRNSNLRSEISKVGEEIDLQNKAYDRYKQERDSVGLSKSLAKKVRNGTIDISTITNEDTAKKVKEYQEWHDKMLECKDAIEDLKDKEAELYMQKFDNVSAKYDGILQGYEHTETMLNEYISQAEAKGHIVSGKYYDELAKNEKNNIAKLKKEQAALIAARDEAVDSGVIKKYSQDWYDMCGSIDAVTQAIEEGETALIEYAKSAEEANRQLYELTQNRFSNVVDEADFLVDLLSYEDLHNDSGKLTNEGMATMGLHAQNQNTYMYKADEAGAEAARLKKLLEKDPYDTDTEKAYNDAVKEQYDYILKAKEEEQSMIDLIKEGIEIELDALQERIDKYEESLDAAKDLYEYNKKVKEQTEEVADIEKQLAAYEGDSSEEGMAKAQELRMSLDEAKQNLEETQYDKYITDQKALLDELYLEYETVLNERLDNTDALLSQIIDAVNAAAQGENSVTTALSEQGGVIATILGDAIGENGEFKTIFQTLDTTTKGVGVTLSTSMSDIWKSEGSANKVVTKYGEGFQGKQTTTNTTLGSIKSGVESMKTALDKDAEKKVKQNKTTTSAKKDPTKTTAIKKTTTTKKTTTKKKSSGDGKAKVGDKVKYVSGQYYYDSYGTKPLGSHNKGKYVYITNVNKKGSHPYHISTGSKLGKGDLGWLKLNQLSGYFTGKKKIENNEVAWTQEKGREFIVRPSDGAILTPVAKNDSVLNAAASSNIWNMANSPAEFIKENLGLGVFSVPNNSSVNNNMVQNFENVVFSMPNVQNYNEMLMQMQKDKSFEKLIMAMTIDRVAGGSSLAKNKAIR